MTKQIMQQYEKIRSSGVCNMFDYNCVTHVAAGLGYEELAELKFTEYKDLLMNFNKYMKKFKIKQK